ncbi:MAG: Glyoxal reductase [Chlamydiae bacterium]|nr:Glyoxal reductase [Chlamydiota bacterium]
MKIPMVGLGTWKLRGKECVDVICRALEIGYRHIDTAFVYENHKEVGEGIKSFDRSKLFLTSKLSIGQAGKDMYLSQVEDTNIEGSVEAALDLALKELDTDYLDAFLIHWPYRERPLEEILVALFKMVDKGKLRFPGVSNYTMHHLQDAYDAGLKVPFNQVEFHPYLNQEELRKFCEAHDTQLIAYRPFGKGKILESESLFEEIGKPYGKNGAQVILRWLIQKNIASIAKSISSEHLKDNLNVFDFALTPSDEAQIDALNKNFRYAGGDWNEFEY